MVLLTCSQLVSGGSLVSEEDSAGKFMFTAESGYGEMMVDHLTEINDPETVLADGIG